MSKTPNMPDLAKPLASLATIWQRQFTPCGANTCPPLISLNNIMDVMLDGIAQVLKDPEAIIKWQQLWQNKHYNLLANNDNASDLEEYFPKNKGFTHELWEISPWLNYIKGLYGLNSFMLTDIVESIKGLDDVTKAKLAFYVKQLIYASSPLNFPLANPEVLSAFIASNGANFIKGGQNFLEDLTK